MSKSATLLLLACDNLSTQLDESINLLSQLIEDSEYHLEVYEHVRDNL